MKTKDRWALSLLENVKVFIEKAYPTDKKLIGLVNEALHTIAWKVHENESRINSTRH